MNPLRRFGINLPAAAPAFLAFLAFFAFFPVAAAAASAPVAAAVALAAIIRRYCQHSVLVAGTYKDDKTNRVGSVHRLCYELCELDLPAAPLFFFLGSRARISW